MTRHDLRAVNELRPVQIDNNYLMHPEGSVLITVGNTKVICTATIEEKVPGFYVDKVKVGLRLNIPCYHALQSNAHVVKALQGR